MMENINGVNSNFSFFTAMNTGLRGVAQHAGPVIKEIGYYTAVGMMAGFFACEFEYPEENQITFISNLITPFITCLGTNSLITCLDTNPLITYLGKGLIFGGIMGVVLSTLKITQSVLKNALPRVITNAIGSSRVALQLGMFGAFIITGNPTSGLNWTVIALSATTGTALSFFR